MTSSALLVIILAVAAVSAKNYDSLIRESAARNLALREEMLEKQPATKEAFSRLQNHELFQDLDDKRLEGHEWDRVLRLIQKMSADEGETGAPMSLEMEEEVPSQLEGQRIRLMAREGIEPRRSEEVFQNHLNGEHRIVGGSSEVGAWLEYALQGAGAQDDDEELEIQPQKSEDIKVDRLPAYCDPPNPCPLGYDPAKLPAPCDEHIQNTKEFNREWIHHKMVNGECACDTEHMKDCPKQSVAHHASKDTPFMQGKKRAHLVAKKAIQKRSSPHIISINPYLGGQVLRRVTKKNGGNTEA